VQRAASRLCRTVLDEAIEFEGDVLVIPDREDSAWLAEVQPPAVLVAGMGNPLLRRVQAIDRLDGAFRLTTTPAALSDVFERLVLRTQLDASAQKSDEPWVDVDFGGLVLYDEGGLRLELSRGLVSFDPSMNLELEIRDQALVRGEFVVTGELGLELALRATAEGHAAWSGETVLWETSRSFLQWISGVPVVEVVTVRLDLGYEVEGRAAVAAEVGAAATITVAGGVRTELGEWTPVSELESEVEAIGPDWAAEAALTSRVFLRPRIDVKLYGVAGPWLGLESDIRFNARLFPSPPGCSAGLGVTGVAGFELGAVGVDLVDYEAELFDAEAVFYTCPRCGDGECNSFEDCASCPIDCGVCADNALALGGGRVDRLGVDGAAVDRFPIDHLPEGGIEVGGRPRGLASNPWFSDRAVVTTGRGGSVELLDMRRGREGVAQTLEVDTYTGAVALSPVGDTAFVALSDEDALLIVDTQTPTGDLRVPLEAPEGADRANPSAVLAARLSVPVEGRAFPDLSVRVFVSMPGTPAAPSGRVAMYRYWPVPSCPQGEVEYLDLPTRSRPMGMALREAGCVVGEAEYQSCLAVALEGTDRVAVLDPIAFDVIDVKPDAPEARFFTASSSPLVTAWDATGAYLYFGHAGGLPGTRLGGVGTVRRGLPATGHDEWDVGVPAAVHSLLHVDDWTYAGDAIGNIVPISVDKWDPENWSIDRDHTGGCLNARGRAEPCPPALTLAGGVRGLQSLDRTDWVPEPRAIVLGSFANDCRVDCLHRVGEPYGAEPITDLAPDGVDIDAFVLGHIEAATVIVANRAWSDPCTFFEEIEQPYIARDPALEAKTVWVEDDCGCP